MYLPLETNKAPRSTTVTKSRLGTSGDASIIFGLTPGNMWCRARVESCITCSNTSVALTNTSSAVFEEKAIVAIENAYVVGHTRC